MAANWMDTSDLNYCVRAEFGDGTVAYTTIEHAADALDFIDRDKGIADLFEGTTFRSHMGTFYRVIDEMGR